MHSVQSQTSPYSLIVTTLSESPKTKIISESQGNLLITIPKRKVCILKYNVTEYTLLLQKGRIGMKWVNDKNKFEARYGKLSYAAPCLKSWLCPSNFASWNILFSFGSVLLPVCFSLLYMPHGSCISKVLGSLPQYSLYIQSFTQWHLSASMQGLPSLTLNCSRSP